MCRGALKSMCVKKVAGAINIPQRLPYIYAYDLAQIFSTNIFYLYFRGA